MNETVTTQDKVLDHRRAGVLLHPSSLPGDQKRGTIGQEARNFLHFMADCGLTVWQMLPLGPTHLDGSPYQCLSSHAGNPDLICLHWLHQRQWLDDDELSEALGQSCNAQALQTAGQRFFSSADPAWIQSFEDFRSNNAYWLEDYSLFMAIKDLQGQNAWTDWPEPLRMCEPAALAEVRDGHGEFIRGIEFTQFVFFTQWRELREYAAELDILLFGDMPIYVSLDSACVWADKSAFLMREDGSCSAVAGVPPDAFSETGQRWGNPLYDWDFLRRTGFKWWINRFRSQLQLFDLVRLDHFRGLEACWHIPAEAETAIDGKWVATPGVELLETLHDAFDSLPLVAEDLGLITPEVLALRDRFDLPGMAVLQFAFDGDSDNLYLPYNQPHNTVVYSGTHDNNTTLGWYRGLSDSGRRHLHHYLGLDDYSDADMPWPLNRMALSSPARLAILPMQDLLGLDEKHRMNTPGTIEDNWAWRMNWGMVWPRLAADLRDMIQLYGRYKSG